MDHINLSVDDCQPLDSESKHLKTLDKYGLAHRWALAFAAYLLSLGFLSGRSVDYAADLKNCGQYLVFRQYLKSNEYRLVQAYFCNHYKICPLCAIRRSAKQVRAYKDKVDYVMKNNPDLKPYFVTLTIKNRSDLSECFNHLTGSFKIYRQQSRDAKLKRRLPVELNKALGLAWAIEIKRGKNSGLFHVHYHMIWLCDSEPNSRELSKEWLSITGDSKIVDVRPLKEGIKAFCEVFKYPLKFGGMSFEDHWLASELLRGRRMVGGLGLLHGIPEPEKLIDDPILDEPYIEHVYQYAFGGVYKKIDKKLDQKNSDKGDYFL